ncbi:MAG: hypothetical protein Q8Q20_05005 [bacterium]|nr:hypothetical protein [bacterium]
MNVSKTIVEIFATAILIVLLVAFLNPTQLLMPTTTETMLVVGIILFFLIFASLVWNERARDERDALHRMRAGRVSFLIGASGLVLGIVVQGFDHAIDPWLIGVLIAMVVSKIIARLYSHFWQ